MPISAAGLGIPAFKAAVATSNIEVEAGLAYQEMKNMGLSTKTARTIALAVGGVNGALEALQVDELAAAYRATAGKAGTELFAERLWNEAKRRFPSVANNVLQEVLQEGTTAAGVSAAAKLETGKWAYNQRDILSRLGDTAYSSLLTFGALEAPAVFRNAATVGQTGSSFQSIDMATVDNSLNGEYNEVHTPKATEVFADNPFDEARELDVEGVPVYATTRKDAHIEAVDFSQLKKSRAEAASQYGLNEKEAASLGNYVQYTYGIMNKRLREGNIDPLRDQPTVNRIVRALERFPQYKGRVYRNLIFADKADYELFLSQHSNGKSVTTKAFTSTSKRPNGFPLFGDNVVHMVLEVNDGADIADTYGIPRQQEVILMPNTRFRVMAVKTANDGNPLIYMQEVPSEVQRIPDDQ